MISRIIYAFALAFCSGLAFCGPSNADLLNLVNGSSNSYSLDFLAGSTGATKISFSGYQNPSYEYVSDIRLYYNGAPVTLSSSWTHTFNEWDSGYQDDNSALCIDTTTGMCAYIGLYPDNSVVTRSSPAIVFANPNYQDFDTWSQIVTNPTASGPNTFTLTFNYSNNPYDPMPSALTVTAVDATGGSGGGITPGVPEASAWVMMLMGLAGLGALGARRKRALGPRTAEK